MKLVEYIPDFRRLELLLPVFSMRRSAFAVESNGIDHLRFRFGVGGGEYTARCREQKESCARE